MTPRNLLVAIVAVAVVAAALTFLLYEPSTAIAQVEAPPRTGQAPPPPVAAVSSDIAVAPTLTQPTNADAQRTEAAPTAVPAPGPLARVVGRCVDTAGQPLAGCRIHLHGWNANSERVDAWRIDHDEDPPWQKLEDVVTGDDGRFAFAFWPPPPFQFAMDVYKDGYGHLSARWGQLDEGQTKDVGDVVLTPGVKVRGQVVDKRGVPQAKVYLSIQHELQRNAIDDAVGPNWGQQVRTKDDGSFETHRWLVPGTYGLRVQDREIESDKQIELVAERPEEVIDVVVAEPPEQATISGRVLDEAGAPVAKVEIMSFMSGHASARSKDDGSFELKARQTRDDIPAYLQVRSDDYRTIDSHVEAMWGATDVVVRVARIGQLVLRVTDAALQPVSRYAVRLLQTDSHMHSSDDSRVRTQGAQEDGVAKLPGLARGNWLILVEFPQQSGFETITHQLQVGDVAPERLDLVARASRTRALRVLDTAGEPIAGANVRLCDMFGKTFTDTFLPMRSEQWMWNLRNLNPKVVQEGRTDDDGRFELRGPGDRALGLLVGGEGACIAHHDEVRLDVEQELIVRVDRGAGVKGHCEPAAGMQALKGLAGFGPTEKFDDRRRPTLLLTRADGATFPDRQLEYVADQQLAIADDGTFAAQGIPAGTWQIAVQASVSLGNGSSTTRRIPLTEVTLTAGETRELTLAGR